MKQKGFTLIEMLVSVTVFAFIMIGIYYFFDTGKWMYMHSENRANLQENARLAVEGMEREMRMIGLGIPNGTEISSIVTWNPPVIYGNVNGIGFRGDVDSYNSLPTANIASGDSSIAVQWPTYICPQDGTILLIIKAGRAWQSTTCTSRSGNTINISPGATAAFPVEETELFSPLQVFYRFSPDADNDGICDQDPAEGNTGVPDYTQCIIERAEERSLAPLATPSVSTLWQTYATNIRTFQLSYFRKTSAGYQSIAAPVGALTNSVDVIRILITARDRAAMGTVVSSYRPQEYQSADFTTDVLIRKHRF